VAVLHKRADLMRQVRHFMHQRGVREADVALISSAANTDPNLEPLACNSSNGGVRYLHTSPEFCMKRLLAAGFGDMYFLGKAFRDGECGRFHNPEFTLCEYYRIGMDYHDLMREVATLVGTLLRSEELPTRTLSYREAFQMTLQIDPLEATTADLESVARSRKLGIDKLQRDQWLDLLMAGPVSAKFPAGALTLVYDYPASQAALAEIDPETGLALRFEAYMGPVELANGYQELIDAQALQGRIADENRTLMARGRNARPVDERFIAAQQAGLPHCSGVALGMDRLLMLATGVAHIDDVLAFPWARA